MIMVKRLTLLFILLALPVAARAQQRPLSPPERAPVPLSEADQRRAEAEESARRKAGPPAQPAGAAIKVKIPVASMGRHISSGNALLDVMVNEAAAQQGLDPCLIFSVMKAESAFNRLAVSPKGASGLMQLMPATAARFGVRNIFEPRENVFGGARYLRWLLNRFGGDVRLALAGYNAGEGAVELYGYRIPPFLETQNYVRTIYSRYSRIHSAGASEPVAAPAQAAAGTSKENIPTYNQIIRLTSTVGDNARSGH